MESKFFPKKSLTVRTNANTDCNGTSEVNKALIQSGDTETHQMNCNSSSQTLFNDKFLKVEEKKTLGIDFKANDKKSNFNLLGFIKQAKDKSLKSIDRQERMVVINRPTVILNTDPTDEHSSGDEKLSKAFGINLSYARTPRVQSEQCTDSIEFENPEIEKSMLTDELRTLKFCLNDDDEFDEQTDSISNPRTSLRKNTTFYNTHKKSIIQESSLNSNSLVLIKNRKETSLLSTQDSRKVARNSSALDQDAIYLRDLNDADMGGLVTVPEQRETIASDIQMKNTYGYGYTPVYNMLEFDQSRQFQKYNQEAESYYFNHYMQNVDNSHLKGTEYSNINNGYNFKYHEDQSSENNKSKKGKRNFWRVEDTSEFEIRVNNIYDENKTTLMIRNIPNKYTKELMLETIDKYFNDTYDFFYLPIDFKNNCNVGYAFINFKALKHIEPFFQKFNNSKWPIFNSDKVCSIKYARIQGKEECEKHFKDSSLMKQTVN